MRASDTSGKISIAMTTYNGERFVREQLQSIANQTRPADEVVIFDDCSTDHTVEIVESFIKEFGLSWKLHVNKRNVGYIENFYNAIGATCGDIIFLCDQDDIWHAEKIEKMVVIFCKNNNIRALYSSFRKIDLLGTPITNKKRRGYVNNGLLKGYIKPDDLKKVSLRHILKGNISPGCTLAFRKECKDVFIKNASKSIFHDWEISIFGALLGGLFFLNEALINYRIHPNNTIGLDQTLPTIMMRFSMKKDQSQRISLAVSDYKRIQPYATGACYSIMKQKEKRIMNSYHHFSKERFEALSQGKLSKWISILASLSYIKAVGMRGIAGDLFFILKNKRKRVRNAQ